MQKFISIAQNAWEIFISERKPGWKYQMQLFAVCSAVGFLSSFLLFLSMHFSLAHHSLGPLLISGFIWILFSIMLFCFKHLRCFSVLFLLSCGLKNGRDALITAGTGVVVASNIQNIFHNLKVLADSITCHLKQEQFALIKYYIEAIKWIYEVANLPAEELKDIVILKHEFTPSYSILDDALKQELNDTEQEIQRIANQISFMLTILPYIGQKILPVFGVFLVSFGTGLFIKKFVGSHSIKFKNAYITKQFIAFDEQQKQQQRPCLLPLNRKERKDYVMIPSFFFTRKDRKKMLRYFLPIIIHLCIWLLFAAVDSLFYLLIISVNKYLQEVPDLDIQLRLSQNTDSFKIPLIKQNCIPHPELALSTTWIQLGVIIFFLVIFGLFSGLLTQLKILVSTSFYPDTEMKRIYYLHAKLLKKRKKLQEKTEKNMFARTVKAVRKKERSVAE
uniref:Dendrocyte expressed seven transmembrane protein n=1 Tax=Zonotrichia albicollis TaxID=44394 RepID=A0A8D2MQQ6_ZONAL